MKQLDDLVSKKQSFLCVGLDSDINKIPTTFKRYKDPILEFNKAIIEATSDLCVSYKINTAFYESMGAKGWETMEKTLRFIPDDIFTIADAKRGDIGNTANQYAKAFFDQLNFDSITLSPYMGKDTIEPFIAYEDKVAIVLALTSNKGSQDFEKIKAEDGKYFYEHVIKELANWAPADKLQFVVGATHPEALTDIRKLAPDNFFLVPGIGAQGGDMNAVYKNGKNENTGLLINVSRGIIYSGNNSSEPVSEIRKAAMSYQKEMALLLRS
ncbi:MAG: orotidine-5'-phosphate decarboxylase [Bacteroidia bacterium]